MFELFWFRVKEFSMLALAMRRNFVFGLLLASKKSNVHKNNGR